MTSIRKLRHLMQLIFVKLSTLCPIIQLQLQVGRKKENPVIEHNEVVAHWTPTRHLALVCDDIVK